MKQNVAVIVAHGEDDERRQKFVIAIDEALGITWLWA